MKRKGFWIVILLVVLAVTYLYIKGKPGVKKPTEPPKTPPVPDQYTIANDPVLHQIRQDANACYKDLKGWSKLLPEPYRPVAKYTKEQFAYFLEFYRTLYAKGFMHHIDHQGLAWDRTSELYQLKLALNHKLV